jgi:hypothetical protein
MDEQTEQNLRAWLQAQNACCALGHSVVNVGEVVRFWAEAAARNPTVAAWLRHQFRRPVEIPERAASRAQ